MIAHEILDTIEDLLLGAVPDVAWDAVNEKPVAYDPASEDEEGFGYLDDRVLPPLPDKAPPPVEGKPDRNPFRACIIGVIDDAIPFAHERLTVTVDGRRLSRVASVWMQGARSLTPSPQARRWLADPVPEALQAALGLGRDPPPVGADLILGRELRGGQIDALLGALGTPLLPDEGALYRATGAIDLARPSPPGWARAGSHGAAVAALAAGFDPDDPEARRFPVIAVCLPPEVTRDTRGSLGPFFIVLAYLHILRRAERLSRFIERRHGLDPGSLELPVAINLSYGITAGPKDGQSLLERFQDALSGKSGWKGLGPVRCVLPAGNHRQSRLHARLQAAPGEEAAGVTQTLRWMLPPDDATPNALEIWGPPEPGDGTAAPRLQVAIRPPGAPGFVSAPFPAGNGWVALSANGAEIARLRRVRHVTAARARDAVTVVVHPTIPRGVNAPVALPGEWLLRISGPGHGPVDVTLQRDESISGFRSGARQSVLEDEDYAERTPRGLQVLEDPDPPESPIRRRGTLNAYATGLLIARAGGAVMDVPEPSFRRAGAAPTLSEVTANAAPDAPYAGMDDDGAGGSRVAALQPDIVERAAADARWKAACERSPVRVGLNLPGLLSGSRQIMRGTSLAAPQVTRYLAFDAAGGPAAGPGPSVGT